MRISDWSSDVCSSDLPDLMRAEPILELQEEVGIERDAARGVGVDLDHPALDSFRIELPVPCRVERVRKVDPPAVPADLDHLRPAVERPGGGMRRPLDDPADPDRAGEPRLERVGDGVLAELARDRKSTRLN